MKIHAHNPALTTAPIGPWGVSIPGLPLLCEIGLTMPAEPLRRTREADPVFHGKLHLLS